MIRFTILNKSKPKSLLLVHGLFTSSGYWLPYLKYLKEYRLIILDINYRRVRDIDYYVSHISGIIEAEAAGAVYAVIAHSLGTLIANLLPEFRRQSSYEICPVYCATKRNTNKFIDEIERKINYAMSGSKIRDLLADVDAALTVHDALPKPMARQLLYLPSADPYFAYHVGHEFMKFQGDHFNITEAFLDIERVLAE